MTRSRVRLAVAGYGLLLAAWVVGNPVFAAPDEWSHYLRAVAIAHGRLLGDVPASYHDPHLDPRQEAWVRQAVREITVPPGMSPDAFACNAFRPEASAACVEKVVPAPREERALIVNGTYQPAGYLLPALFLAPANGAKAALWLARAANAIVCLMLLAIAIRAILPSLLGVAAAATPMALFLAAVLNPSGIEVAGAIAMCAGLVALSRSDGPARRKVWIAIAAGGVALCLSRSLGPLWVLIFAAIWIVWRGIGGAIGVLRAAPGSAGAVSAAIGAAAILNRIWEGLYGPKLHFPRTERLRDAIGQSIQILPRWLREQAGVFGWVDSPMPDWAYIAWAAVVVALILAALVAGRARDRLAMAGATLVAIALPVLLNALVLRPIAWEVQGRHVLPVTVIVPLLAAEIVVQRTADSAFRRIAIAAGAVLCAAVQFTGFLADAHRNAVGVDAGWFFLGRAEWAPAEGWPLLLGMAAIGAACLAAAALPSPTPRQ